MTLFLIFAVYILIYWAGVLSGVLACMGGRYLKEASESGPIQHDEPMPWMDEKKR